MKRSVSPRIAPVAAALVLSAVAAVAQAQSAAPYVGGALGDTDFGTGVRAFGGGSITNLFGWEAQVTSLGSRTVRPGGNLSCSNSAWEFGGSGTARLPLTTGLSAFGKLGAHYLRTRISGPCSNTGDGALKLGLGAGMLWQFSPKAALRLEFENIGGSQGDFVGLGVQFPL